MTKTSGLGDNFYVGGYDLSGDVGSIGQLGGGVKTLQVTGIDKSAIERITSVRDGRMSWSSWFNPAASHSHPVLDALPRTDVHMAYFRGTTLGNPAAVMVAKQPNYDPTRGTDGALACAVDAVANGYGLEWGVQLTAGKRTDTAATNGTSIDTVASASFGAQAYLQVFSFAGTDATVKIQDSADNVTFADVTGLAFTAITAAPASERLQTGRTATIRRYVRAITTTSAGFTSLVFAVVINKNAVTVNF